MSYIDISKFSRDELKTGDIVKYKPEGAVKSSEFYFKLNGGSCMLYEHEDDIGVEGMAVWKPQKTSVDPWRRRADTKNGEPERAEKAVHSIYPAQPASGPATAMNMDYCLARLLEISVREDELARERKEVQRQLVLLVNAEKRPEVSAPSSSSTSASATVSNASTGSKKNKK